MNLVRHEKTTAIPKGTEALKRVHDPGLPLFSSEGGHKR